MLAEVYSGAHTRTSLVIIRKVVGSGFATTMIAGGWRAAACSE